MDNENLMGENLHIEQRKPATNINEVRNDGHSSSTMCSISLALIICGAVFAIIGAVCEIWALFAIVIPCLLIPFMCIKPGFYTVETN